MTAWPYNDLPDGPALPGFELSAEDREQLTERIWSALITGADDCDDFVDAEDGQWPLTEAQLRDAFELMRHARLAQQEQWSPEQTRTNLDRAFDALNESGIVARQNFTCCGTCGAAEIGDERDDSRDWRGYVFFHQQDTESLVEDGEVFLAYGIFAPKDFDWEAYNALPEPEQLARYRADVRRLIDEDVLPTLTAHGLEPEWDSDQGKRILVRRAQWFERLSEAD